VSVLLSEAAYALLHYAFQVYQALEEVAVGSSEKGLPQEPGCTLVQKFGLRQESERCEPESAEKTPFPMEISPEEVILANVQVESRMPLFEGRESFVL